MTDRDYRDFQPREYPFRESHQMLYTYSMYTKVRHTLLVLAAAVSLAAGTLSAKTALAEGEYVPGEVIVVYEESAAPVEQTAAELADRGYEVAQPNNPQPLGVQADAPAQTDTIAVAETPAGVSVEQAVAEVSSLEGVAYAQPNYVYRIVEPMSSVTASAVALNDTYFKRGYLKNLELASVRNAWELMQTNHKVTVAVLDSGCRLSHEDLTNNVNWLYAWDFINNTDNGGQPLTESIDNDDNDYGDGNGHGTHVCGIVGAQANNNVGVAGASYNASIIPMRVVDTNGRGTTETVIKALKKVLELKNDANDPVNIRVVNISLGGEGDDTAINNQIDKLTGAGILCVCAAGNESSSGACTPADAPQALSVMAIDKNKAHTSYTNYKVGGQINTSKTVSAMGGGGTSNDDCVWSTYKASDGDYNGLVGTSQATPLVSGVAALIFAANPNLSANDARAILTSTTEEVNGNGSYSFKDAASAGMVNAYRAVSAAQNVDLRIVDAPSAVGETVYTGLPQTGVTAHEAYTLSTVPYDPEQDEQDMSTSSAIVHEGAKETNAGHYRTTAHLVTGYQWSDGTTTDKIVEWTIEKAPLIATYAGGSYQVGDHVNTDVVVSGFVNNETAQTAAGYVAPVLDLQGAVDANGNAQLPAGEYSRVYEPTLTGGGADNYYFQEYDQEYVTVTRLKPVAIPQAATTLVYTGKEQAGVPEGDDYTVEGGRQTNAGTYEATVRLKEPSTHAWEDGTTEDKVVEWTIAPAKLRLIYNGAKMMVGDSVNSVALNISIMGFVNGESAATLSGFVVPGLVQVVGNVSPADTNSVAIASNDISIMADPSAYKPLDASLTSTPGAKTLIPISKSLADIDPGHVGNPTLNYEFFESQSGTLDVYGRATAPTRADYTYDGQAKQGVRGGANCVITGTSSATAVGTHTAKATPNDHYIWSDKNLNASDKDAPRTYTWKISAASIAGALVSGIGNVTYSGRAVTPVPTVRVNGRTLANGTDYTVSYRNNLNVGTATVTIAGKGNYTGTLSRNFTISKATLTATYAGGTMNVGSNPPTTVNVTGFVGGQNAASAAGYRAPTVSISAKQRATAGTYTITPSGGSATNYNFVYRSGTLRVVTVPVSKVTLNHTSLSLKPGTSASIVATVTPSNATNKAVTWKSSNTSVATVNGLGLVTALSQGTTTITATAGGRTSTCTVTVATPAAHVAYRTHVQNVGWQGYVRDGAMSGTSGRSLRLEGINIKLEGQPYSGGIEYRTYVQSKGWMGWVANNVMSGTSGQSLRLEGIQIRLTGEMAKYYDVWYRVHCQNIGWMGWAKNGGTSGTVGYDYRLESINVVILPKGSAAPGSTAGPARQALVRYHTHVQNVGWQGYVVDGAMSGTSGQSLRLEGIDMGLVTPAFSGGIEYRTHIQNIGWENTWRANGAMSGTSGRALRLEAIQIRLTGEMAKHYDVYYRVHCQNIGWMGWAKNGSQAGSAGFAYRLEGINIVLVPKGGAAPGPTAGAFAQR